MAKRRWQFETWEADLEEESKLDTPVKKANTLEELATLCGMDAQALTDTVTRYNQFCAKGLDEDFGKARRASGAHLQPWSLLRHLRPALF